MLPCVSLGWGTRLHLIQGAKVTNVNLTFINDSTEVYPRGSWAADNTSADSNYYGGLFGGRNTILPGGFANHKPGAFYAGNFYFTGHLAENDPKVYIAKWDGSGIFKHGGFTGGAGYDANWRNGRGTQLISPSGTSIDISRNSVGHIVHNGVLFMLGASAQFITNGSTWTPWINMGWGASVASGDIPSSRLRRKYDILAIDKRSKSGKETKIAVPTFEFFPNALTQEDTNTCDVISAKNDIIYANYIDVLRFPGGSGHPQLIESNLQKPSSKCFEYFPASGFDTDGSILGNTELMMLEGSGLLIAIHFPNGIGSAASGTRTIIDLGDLVTDVLGDKLVRTFGVLARVDSTTDEPQRSCFLKSFNNQLHAFFPSQASGYYHLVCTGSPAVEGNWSNRTALAPIDFKSFDGDIYGYRDFYRNTLYIMHCSKSEIGLWGTLGGQKGAGGVVIKRLGTNLEWNDIYSGVWAEPPIGLIPYNNIGVYGIIGSGQNPEVIPSTDYALIDYTLNSAFSYTVNITVEYTVDNGITWNTARRFRDRTTGNYLGDSTQNLQSSFFGNAYTFYWDYVGDLGFNSQKNCTVRITPFIVR